VFHVGQRVVTNHTEFKGAKGVILDKQLYYRVKFDYKVNGYSDALFKEEELKLWGPENILEYVKLRLIGAM